MSSFRFTVFAVVSFTAVQLASALGVPDRAIATVGGAGLCLFAGHVAFVLGHKHGYRSFLPLASATFAAGLGLILFSQTIVTVALVLAVLSMIDGYRRSRRMAATLTTST